MPKQSMKPAKMRLTLTKPATSVFANIVKCKNHAWVCILRSDGKYDLPISASLYDQLSTAALPRENFSDTVLRLAKGIAA